MTYLLDVIADTLTGKRTLRVVEIAVLDGSSLVAVEPPFPRSDVVHYRPATAELLWCATKDLRPEPGPRIGGE